MMSELPDLQKRRDRSDEGGGWNKSTKAVQHLTQFCQRLYIYPALINNAPST
jgi:hypothetical protein